MPGLDAIVIMLRSIVKHGSEHHANEGRGGTTLYWKTQPYFTPFVTRNDSEVSLLSKTVALMPSYNWRTSAVYFLGQPNFSIISTDSVIRLDYVKHVIPDKSLVNFIMTTIASRSFIMHVGADRSKQRFLKNCLPQGSVLAPLLFNLYTSDLPKTQSKKYIYADDIAFMISVKTFGPIEQSLSEDLDNMSRYFNNWRLKINTGKTVCTSFHLAHRLAKYQLQVTCEGQNIPHEDNPKYLGVTLDRTNSNIQDAHK